MPNFFARNIGYQSNLLRAFRFKWNRTAKNITIARIKAQPVSKGVIAIFYPL